VNFLGYVIAKLFVQFSCDIPSFLRKQESSNLAWVSAFAGTTVTQSNYDRPGSRFGIAPNCPSRGQTDKLWSFLKGVRGKLYYTKKFTPYIPSITELQYEIVHAHLFLL
jgi:hypothetical protein